MKVLIQPISSEKLDNFKSRDLVPIICPICLKQFTREKHLVQASIKNNTLMFCCQECLTKFNNQDKKRRAVVACELCKTEFMQKATTDKFCSHSCSAKFNNAKERNPGRKYGPAKQPEKLYYCKCGNIKPKTYHICKECTELKNLKVREKSQARPITGLFYNSGDANRYSLIRTLARKYYIGTFVCESCGYDKHVEICHIKAINSFDSSALISEVNADDNLVALCPNCHWEFDHPCSEE